MNKKLYNVACRQYTWHSKVKGYGKKLSTRMLRRMLNKECKA